MPYEGLGNDIQFRRRTLPGCVSIRDIQDIVGRKFGVRHGEMICDSRKRNLAYPRQIAMFLAREYSGQSFPAIGHAFGDRDHTTILFAWRKMSATTDEQALAAVRELREEIEALICERTPAAELTASTGLSAEVAEANALLLCAA